MTPAEIIAMLASVGVVPCAKRPKDWNGYVAVFSDFAALVAAKEREACAQVCESWDDPRDYAAAIRARGQKEGA